MWPKLVKASVTEAIGLKHADREATPASDTAQAFLTAAMNGTWRDLQQHSPAGSIDYLDWRRSVVEALQALPHDCVVFTHYIAINVVAGFAQRREDVVCFRPDHASVTLIETRSQGLRLIELGREAQTGVLTR